MSYADGPSNSDEPVETIGARSFDGLHEIVVGHAAVVSGRSFSAGDCAMLDGSASIASESDGCRTLWSIACLELTMDVAFVSE